MTRARLLLVLACITLGAFTFRAQSQTPAPAYKFQQVQPGIYSAIGTGTLNVGSNSAVIINQDDVVIVDSHITPESARVMLRELKAITDKPVRTVINTHFHFDHANGNQIFQPPVEIIGHEFTRAKLLSSDLMQVGTFANALANLPNNIESLKGRVAAESDPAAKARLEQQLRVQQAYAVEVKEVRPTPPNVTLDNRMTLFRGDREIRVLSVGRGHTGGDVVVYLPKERLLCTGDLLLTTNTPFGGDGYVNEWPDTLEKMKALDFEDVIPGHGEPFKGKEKIGQWQAFLRDLWQQTAKLHDAHVLAAEAVKRIDLTAHKAHFQTITGIGVGVDERAVSRMYAVMEQRAQ